MFNFGFTFSAAGQRSTKGPISLITPAGLGAFVIFSRASTAYTYDATGDLVSVPIDTPRLDHAPSSGSVLGTLIEPASTNIFTHSVARVADWTFNQGAYFDVALYPLSPFPGMSIASTGASFHRTNHPNVLLQSGVTYAISIWFQPDTSPNFRLSFRSMSGNQTNWGGTFAAPQALSQGVAGTVSSYDQTTTVGGSIMLRVLFTPNETTDYSIGLGPFSETSGASLTVLGAQLEQATHPSSYINTIGTSQTRAPDLIGTTGLNGTYDVHVTYGDDTSETFAAQTVSDGYWPTLSQNHVKSMTAKLV